MSVKDWFDMVYAGLVVVAIIAYCGVKLYSLKHTIKNKWVADIPDLAVAFVHEAETTNGEGTAKMAAVINEVSRVLAARGVKIDSTIEAAIRAFAEKEVAKMNTSKDDTVAATTTPSTAEDFDENQVKDLTKESTTFNGADTNA